MKLFKNKKRVVWTAAIGGLVAVLMIFSAVYLSDYYHTDTEAAENFKITADVTEKELSEGVVAFVPEEAAAGFIFYPGGKVEHTAYEPLARALAEKGIATVIIKMPFNLAVFDINAAKGITEKLPDIEKWYIGGHSLGGSMAASYLSKNTDEFEGLILLAAYSTADFSGTDEKVFSIYGSEDGVLNREKYDEYESNLPDGYTEYIIEGGCHAGFGMYGAQKGDGKPSLASEEQIRITGEEIYKFVTN